MPASTAKRTVTFNGVTTTPTKRGYVRRPALLKMLRRGGLNITCRGRYTDDYAYDNATGFSKGEQIDGAELARQVEDGSGWQAELRDDALIVSCHTFLSYEARVW